MPGDPPPDASDGPADDTPDASAGGDVRCYLVCPPARPIRLKPDVPVTIGRGDGNAVVIADSAVSRNHAVIEWRDDRYVVRDLGSSNGVHVNDVRVAEAGLASEDSIRIGERVFTFLEGDEAAIRRTFLHQREEQRKRKTHAFRKGEVAEPAHGLTGGLDDFGLGDLLQAMQLGSKSGRITVTPEAAGDEGETGPPDGEILVRDGEIAAASFGEERNEEAVYRMLEIEHGSFRFEATEVDAPREVRANVAALLMEGFRRADEEHREELTEAPAGKLGESPGDGLAEDLAEELAEGVSVGLAEELENERADERREPSGDAAAGEEGERAETRGPLRRGEGPSAETHTPE